MSVDKLTQEQRRDIHERGRAMGVREGISSGTNQLASFIGPAIGKISVFALDIGMHAKDVSAHCRDRFTGTAWQELGIISLEDMTVVDDETIITTQESAEQGTQLLGAIDLALPVFNLRRNA